MLKDIYEQWRLRGAAEVSSIAGKFFAPLLVCPPHDWADARHRIIYVGQETGCWIWNKSQAEEYGYEWKYEDMYVLQDFLDNKAGVDALVHGYKLFDFALSRPKNVGSPFWCYFRLFKEYAQRFDESVSILFTNIIRCAVDSEAGYTLWSLREADRRKLLEWQNGLLRAELAALRPTLILFVTGPHYDRYLKSELGELGYSTLRQFDLRTLTRIEGAAPPAKSYRTYHPGYLNRCFGFAPLEVAINDALQID